VKQKAKRKPLVLTSDLFIIRLKKGVKDPEHTVWRILHIPTEASNWIFNLKDYYPEANVFVWKINARRPSVIRNQIINTIRTLNDSRVAYIGRIRKRSDTGVYQIYTGNMFLSLEPNKATRIDFLCEKYNLRLKNERVANLQFAESAFYAEVNHEAHDVFKISERMLIEHPDLVLIAEPELIVKRKIFQTQPTVFTTNEIQKSKASSRNSIPEPLGSYADASNYNSWVTQRTRLDQAQKITKGDGVIIGIIDDGIESAHPAFDSQKGKAISRDFLGAETDHAEHQYSNEKHGTACASIALSSDKLAPGVAPESRLLVARTKGLGSILEAEAISWAANNKADIISCSWGPTDGDLLNPDVTPLRHPLPAATELALKHASKKGRDELGCLIVFAAGNGNEPLTSDEYANNQYVIAVGSTNRRDQRASYSDYGPNLFCCFPSSDILVVKNRIKTKYGRTAADRLGKLGYSSGDYFYSFGGTSAAAPAVAGIAALVLSIAPKLKVDQLKNLLQASCKQPRGKPYRRTNELGHGILDALTAVQLAQKLTGIEVPNEFDTPFKILINLSPELSIKQIDQPKKRNPMTNKAVSLHIGVNKVDPSYYPGYNVPNLLGCVNDAKAWQEYAEETGYQSPILLTNKGATRENVLNALNDFAKNLKAGDICLLTYAGHGSQIETDDVDEIDDYDETWLLSNGILLDDEIDEAASKFKEGVRLVIISDSCHSGTASRNISVTNSTESNPDPNALTERKVDSVVARSNYNAHKEKYEELKRKAANRLPTKAFVKLLPGCQDQQTSKEINSKGVFTSELLRILKSDDEAFKKINYAGLLEIARKKLNNHQQLPTVFDTGRRSQAFDSQYPLDISIPDGLLQAVDPTEINKVEEINEGEDFISQKENSKNSNLQTKTFESEEVNLIIGTIEGSKSKETKTYSNRDLRTGNKRAIRNEEHNVPYDYAYQFLAENPDAGIDYVEVDQSSKIGPSPQQKNRAVKREREDNDLGFMEAYAFPKAAHINRIIWHLGDEYTQLRKASEFLHPEIAVGIVPLWEPKIPVVAMIDTGLRYDYPTLPENIDKDFARSFDKKGRPIVGSAFDRSVGPEKQGHGTATANLLAGGFLSSYISPDKAWSGIIGAAPQVKIVPLRISESVVILNPRAFAAALNYAIKIKADVVSMSMAGAPSNKMADAINEAYLQGVVVVTAGGNQWDSGLMKHLPDALMYPARFDRVIAAVGVAYDGKPYRADLTKSDVQARSEGGGDMGSCYGPETVNNSVIAAYTPNTLWAGGDGDKVGKSQATMDGGGTSTATPQIAAAAAMWLELHGENLDKAITAFGKTNKGIRLTHPKYGLKWMRTEAVREALIKACKKKVGMTEENKHYDHLYGNGVLQAFEALRYRPIIADENFEPNELKDIEEGYIDFNIDELTSAREADISFFGILESAQLLMSAYRAFGRRSRSVDEIANSFVSNKDEMKAVRKTISAEIFSLLYGIDELRPFRNDPFHEGKLNPDLALELLKNEYDDKLSETLRMVLSPYATKEESLQEKNNFSRGVGMTIPNLYALAASTDKDSNAANIITIANQVGIAVNNKRDTNYGDANDLQYEEFEIKINTERLRSSNPTDPLKVIINPENNLKKGEAIQFGALATLIEKYDENNLPVGFEWHYDGNEIRGTRNIAIRKNTDLGPGLEFNIDLNIKEEGVRGSGKFVKKIIGKVFKLFVRKDDTKLGKEVHRSYQLRHLNMNSTSLTKRLGKAYDITGDEFPDIPNLGENTKSLLLIHGMFATVESSFGKLLDGNNEIIKQIREKYGARVFGFEHPSVVESFDSNFTNLIKLHELFIGQEVDVIAMSRGTHLARRMRLGDEQGQPLFHVDRAMYLGGTTFGTDIAREDRTYQLLKRMTGLLYHAGKLTGPQIGGIIKLLEKLANKAGKAIINLPGITDQVPGSEATTQIANAYNFHNDKDVWVGANWQPSANSSNIARIIDRVNDNEIFGNSLSDGVAPYPGSLGYETSTQIKADDPSRILLNPSETHHFQYYKNEIVLNKLKSHLLVDEIA